MKYVEEKSSGGESEQHYFMVQGNDSLEVNSDTELDDSSSCDEYISLKNDLDTHVCHASVASPPSVSIACTSSSIIKNDIYMLKKSVDCLGSTLSQCALNHTRLESMFQTKQVPSMHAHHTRHTHASHGHHHPTMYAHVYTCTHCGRKGHLARFCYDRIHDEI